MCEGAGIYCRKKLEIGALKVNASRLDAGGGVYLDWHWGLGFVVTGLGLLVSHADKAARTRVLALSQ